MYKKAFALTLCLFVSILLSACFDAVEIGDYAYVATVGIDEGVTDKLRITFHIPKFSQAGGEGGGGGGGEESEESETLTVESSSFLSAESLANTNIPLTLNFMHLKAFIISEDLASSGNLGEYFAALARYRQIRRSTPVIVVKGKAEEFVKASKPYLGSLITKTFENLTGKSETTGLFPKVTFNDTYNSIKSNSRGLLSAYGALNKGENLEDEGEKYEGEYKIPGDYYAGDVPRKDGQEIELLGSTVSDGDKVVGKLTGFETQMVLLVRRELKSVSFTIPDPQKPELIIPIEIKEFEKPKTTIDVQGDKPKINTIIRLEGDIGVIQSRINYEDPKMKKILEDAFEQYIKEGIERTFSKCQEFKSDVFNFGDTAVRKFWTIPEWENYKWHNKFADAELKVEIDFTVRRTGTIHKSMPIISTEGKE